jgi:hypothetical protein
MWSTSNEPPARLDRCLALSRVFAIVLALPLGACSYRYVDEAGVQHVVGLVALAIPPAEDERRIAGDIIEVTTLGVSFSVNAQGGGLTIGFNQERSGVLRDDSLVLGDPASLVRPQRPNLSHLQKGEVE